MKSAVSLDDKINHLSLPIATIEQETCIKNAIHAIPDFPKPGILFRDITPLLASPTAFATTVDVFANRYQEAGIEAILGLESRGFLFGAALSYKMGIPLIPVRKKGRLPRETFKQTYLKEYGEDVLELHVDDLQPNQQILIIDDLIATGGTAEAAIKLVKQAGANPVEIACVIELEALKGRDKLSAPVYTIVKY